MKYKTLGIIALSAILLAGVGLFIKDDNNSTIKATTAAVQGAANFEFNPEVVLYKSPTCGCCSGYAKALREEGFKVEVVETDDMAKVKGDYGIPADKQSCHTIALADYVIEGHVPMEAVKKLMSERPNIKGIGLPRMPSGTPGMPGPKRTPYEVYQLSPDGLVSPYITI